MSIKLILQSLSPPLREQIMYSFENEEPDFVEYETGKFLGVNIVDNQSLKVDDVSGVWSSGLILKGRT